MIEGPRGVCPVCDATPLIRSNGTLRAHPAPAGTPARPGITANCTGTGRTPKEQHT